eukprot:6756957-Prymnesium_polylepis.1
MLNVPSQSTVALRVASALVLAALATCAVFTSPPAHAEEAEADASPWTPCTGYSDCEGASVCLDAEPRSAFCWSYGGVDESINNVCWGMSKSPECDGQPDAHPVVTEDGLALQCMKGRLQGPCRKGAGTSDDSPAAAPSLFDAFAGLPAP